MAPGEARTEDVRAWLQKAAYDLRADERGMSASEESLRSDVVFHAPQAGEALKTAHEVLEVLTRHLPKNVQP